MIKEKRLTWQEVRDIINMRIVDRVYGPNHKLPKDEDLATELGCVRLTVQRAMTDLVEAGLIERKRKAGTRVIAHPATKATFEIPIVRLEVENLGRSYRYQLLSKEISQDSKTLSTLGVSKNTDLLHLRAIHFANDKPFIYEDRFVSLKTAPEIAAADLDKMSANEWLVTNKPYTRCDVRFFAQNADATVAELCHIGEGDALFIVNRTTFTGDDLITTVQAHYMPGYEMLSQSER